MFKSVILYGIFLLACLVNIPAQEVVTGLQSNYAVIKNAEKHRESKGLTSADTLALPFFDDFSGHSIFPDIKKWTDSYVFINNTYSDRQITAGIATFDALDNSGRMYSTANSTGFEADHLTSQPINLNYRIISGLVSFIRQAVSPIRLRQMTVLHSSSLHLMNKNGILYGKLQGAPIKDLNLP